MKGADFVSVSDSTSSWDWSVSPTEDWHFHIWVLSGLSISSLATSVISLVSWGAYQAMRDSASVRICCTLQSSWFDSSNFVTWGLWMRFITLDSSLKSFLLKSDVSTCDWSCCLCWLRLIGAAQLNGSGILATLKYWTASEVDDYWLSIISPPACEEMCADSS